MVHGSILSFFVMLKPLQYAMLLWCSTHYNIYYVLILCKLITWIILLYVFRKKIKLYKCYGITYNTYYSCYCIVSVKAVNKAVLLVLNIGNIRKIWVWLYSMISSIIYFWLHNAFREISYVNWGKVENICRIVQHSVYSSYLLKLKRKTYSYYINYSFPHYDTHLRWASLHQAP